MEDINKDLELREFIIEDDFGNVIGDLSLISFVSSPAIKQDYKLFGAGRQVFAQTDVEKQVVTGPAMRPNIPILRQDPYTGKYFNGIFSNAQVRKCSEIYLKNSNHTRTNIEHGQFLTSNEIDGVYVVESWLVEDPANDKATALGFKEVQKGDWYVSYKIDNKAFWEFLKVNGGGFSIEGMFLDRLIENFANIEENETTDRIKNILFSSALSDKEKERRIKLILNLE